MVVGGDKEPDETCFEVGFVLGRRCGTGGVAGGGLHDYEEVYGGGRRGTGV